jgi:hypothetical protein
MLFQNWLSPLCSLRNHKPQVHITSTYIIHIFTDYGRPMKPFFIKISNFSAWADNLGWLIWGYFRPIYQHPFWYCESLVHVFHYFHSIISSYPNPKYLFGIWIWIWAAKNSEFSHRVSVVRAYIHVFTMHASL